MNIVAKIGAGVLAVAVILGGAALPAEAKTPIKAKSTISNTIAVYGDSNSTGHSVDLWNGYNLGLAYSAHMPDFTLVGGWAHDGATSIGIKNHATLVSAANANIGVFSIGTNDIDNDIPRDATIANLVAGIQKTGIQHVILEAVPPYNGNIDVMASYNRRLKATAALYGWEYYDAYFVSGIKASGSVWATHTPAWTLDGKHPTPAGYALMGQTLNDYILTLGWV